MYSVTRISKSFQYIFAKKSLRKRLTSFWWMKSKATKNITSSSRTLISSCVVKRNHITQNTSLCTYCLQCFTSDAVLNGHKETCIVINGAQAIKMRKRANQLNFKIITRNCKYPLSFTQILKRSQGKYQVVLQTTVIHTQKRIRSTKIVHPRIK